VLFRIKFPLLPGSVLRITAKGPKTKTSTDFGVSEALLPTLLPWLRWNLAHHGEHVMFLSVPNFKVIGASRRPCEARNSKFGRILNFCGSHTHQFTDWGYISNARVNVWCALPCQTSPWSVYTVAPAGRKTAKNRKIDKVLNVERFLYHPSANLACESESFTMLPR